MSLLLLRAKSGHRRLASKLPVISYRHIHSNTSPQISSQNSWKAPVITSRKFSTTSTQNEVKTQKEYPRLRERITPKIAANDYKEVLDRFFSDHLAKMDFGHRWIAYDHRVKGLLNTCEMDMQSQNKFESLQDKIDEEVGNIDDGHMSNYAQNFTKYNSTYNKMFLPVADGNPVESVRKIIFEEKKAPLGDAEFYHWNNWRAFPFGITAVPIAVKENGQESDLEVIRFALIHWNQQTIKLKEVRLVDLDNRVKAKFHAADEIFEGITDDILADETKLKEYLMSAEVEKQWNEKAEGIYEDDVEDTIEEGGIKSIAEKKLDKLADQLFTSIEEIAALKGNAIESKIADSLKGEEERDLENKGSYEDARGILEGFNEAEQSAEEFMEAAEENGLDEDLEFYNEIEEENVPALVTWMRMEEEKILDEYENESDLIEETIEAMNDITTNNKNPSAEDNRIAASIYSGIEHLMQERGDDVLLDQQLEDKEERMEALIEKHKLLVEEEVLSLFRKLDEEEGKKVSGNKKFVDEGDQGIDETEEELLEEFEDMITQVAESRAEQEILARTTGLEVERTEIDESQILAQLQQEKDDLLELEDDQLVTEKEEMETNWEDEYADIEEDDDIIDEELDEAIQGGIRDISFSRSYKIPNSWLVSMKSVKWPRYLRLTDLQKQRLYEDK